MERYGDLASQDDYNGYDGITHYEQHLENCLSEYNILADKADHLNSTLVACLGHTAPIQNFSLAVLGVFIGAFLLIMVGL